MPKPEREEAAVLAPDTRAMLQQAGAPWLAPLREKIAAMQRQKRLAHGLLLSGPPGAGQSQLGAWIAARLLCRERGAEVCGQCPDCRPFLAGSHPDFFWIGVETDKKEIGVDQMRALTASASLRSYRGGPKIAVIAPAEAMNIHSFNALLKTLEEPSSETYLVLPTSRIDRIPRTIVSRCMRLRVPLPTTAAALTWLGGVESRNDWPQLLELAGGTPFLAEEYARTGLGGLDGEMREMIAAAQEGRLDMVGYARSCAEQAPATRLAWLESWLTRSLKDAALASDLVNNNRLPWLRPPGIETKIRAGYRLLDQLRDARRLVGGPLNTQLLFEGLLVSVTALVSKPRGKAGE